MLVYESLESTCNLLSDQQLVVYRHLVYLGGDTVVMRSNNMDVHVPLQHT